MERQCDQVFSCGTSYTGVCQSWVYIATVQQQGKLQTDKSKHACKVHVGQPIFHTGLSGNPEAVTHSYWSSTITVWQVH